MHITRIFFIVLLLVVASTSTIVAAPRVPNDSKPDTLELILQKLDKIITLQETQEGSPTASVVPQQDDAPLQEMLHSKDSLEALLSQAREDVNTLKAQLSQANDRVKYLEQYLPFADDIVARLSDDCLRHPYNKEKVDRMISLFPQMYSENLRKTFAPMLELLKEYGQHTDELMVVLSEAENDPRFLNKISCEDAQTWHIDKIKKTTYYTKHYGKNWYIPFLTNAIDQAINRINERKNDISVTAQKDFLLTPLLRQQ